ncbi:MAG: flagellin, partial [Pseudomonadota bacterium]
MKIGESADQFTAIQTNAAFRRAGVEDALLRPTERLATGLRVNKASDDAASLAIASRISTEATALQQAALNAGQAASALQIADGAMAEINGLLTRMKVLALAGTSENLSDSERALLDTEFQALKEEAGRIAIDTTFRGRHILGDDNAPVIPFSEIGLRVRPGTSGGGALLTLSNNGDTGSAGNFTEFVFQYRSTETVTGVSYTNARITTAGIGAEGGETIAGVTVPVIGSNVDPDDGFIANNGDPLPDGTAGVLVEVTGTDDLDVVFLPGTDGVEFEVELDFTYTPASTGVSETIRFTFGSATVGGISD